MIASVGSYLNDCRVSIMIIIKIARLSMQYRQYTSRAPAEFSEQISMILIEREAR